jgi:hypothetical protein
MYVLITGFIILNVFFGFIDSIVVGASDLQVTKLTVAMTDVVTTITVQDTSGYRVSDWVRIGDEKVKYNGKTATTFTNAVRGYDGTLPKAHAIGSHVYGRMSDALNSSVGFNLVDTGASVGTINSMSLVVRFAETTIPSMVQWNFYWMKDGFWQYVRLLCVGISGALIFLIALQILGALGGLLQSAFKR